MTIKEFFNNISNADCPKLKDSDNCETIGELYKQLEDMKCFPSNCIIKRWHKLLKDYINQDDAVFFIRRYASGKKDGKWDTRRGLLTEVKSDDIVLRYVFVDNYFAQYFFAMAYNGFVPTTLDDFKKFINEKKMPYGCRVTKEEEDYQAYKKGDSYPLGKNGWKLSHVYSANENDYDFDYKHEKDTLFPKGEYGDWDKKNKIRTLTQSLDDDDIRKIKAHFLRVVHPINYFLTPQKELQTSKRGITDIGEYPPMIEYRKKMIMESPELKEVFEEFKKLIMAPDCDDDLGKRKIMLGYNGVAKSKNTSKNTNSNNQANVTNNSQNTTSTKSSKRRTYTINGAGNYKMYEVIKEFVVDQLGKNRSFSDIKSEIDAVVPNIISDKPNDVKMGSNKRKSHTYNLNGMTLYVTSELMGSQSNHNFVKIMNHINQNYPDFQIVEIIS